MIRKLKLKCPECGKEYEIVRKVENRGAMLMCSICGNIAPLYRWLG